jgi:hypothetical protein
VRPNSEKAPQLGEELVLLKVDVAQAVEVARCSPRFVAPAKIDLNTAESRAFHGLLERCRHGPGEWQASAQADHDHEGMDAALPQLFQAPVTNEVLKSVRVPPNERH